MKFRIIILNRNHFIAVYYQPMAMPPPNTALSELFHDVDALTCVFSFNLYCMPTAIAFPFL